MSTRRTKRILNEIKELNDSSEILEQNGIYIYYDDTNINNIYAMLVGPPDTPYEKGFYFFKFEYPTDYPMTPPIAKYYTQGSLKNQDGKMFNVRFNPNLYVCGKVCLSMLNTWAGPGWVPTNTMSNVLVAIVALVLIEDPLTNEPGFEKALKKDLDKYSEIIAYANIQISVLNMIENPPLKVDYFKNKMIEIFMKNVEYYTNFILKKNDYLKDSTFESPYNMSYKFNYIELLDKIDVMKERILHNIANESIDNTVFGIIDSTESINDTVITFGVTSPSDTTVQSSSK
jgi:ubiquitin-protein ligase